MNPNYITLSERVPSTNGAQNVVDLRRTIAENIATLV